jgi:FkbM family methyltransferase
MKLKNLFELAGLRGRPRRYGYSVRQFELNRLGVVQYAQWNHPHERPKTISQEAVEQYRRFIAEGDFCIDIGAHTGDSTLPIALAAGVTGAVLALEPNPYVFPILEKNARLNRGRTRILPMLAAAVETEGEMTFEYSDSGYCNGGRHEGISPLKHGHAFQLTVHGVNLPREMRSDYADLLPRLRFIKVDAEGYDLYVIHSLAELIDEFRPCVKTELYKYTSRESRAALISFFTERGYRVYRIAEEPCLPGEPVTPGDVMRWGHFDVLCEPRAQ